MKKFLLAPILISILGISKCPGGSTPPVDTTKQSQFVSWNAKAEMQPCEVYTLKMTWKNTSIVDWTDDAGLGFIIGSIGQDVWGITRFGLGNVTVKVGESHEYFPTIKAPCTPGEYKLQWQMLYAKTGTFFGEKTPEMVVKVKQPDIPVPVPNPTLGISGTDFTLNNTKTFLTGFSYYGGLEIPIEQIKSDLSAMQAKGFNWFRLWILWNEWVPQNASLIDRSTGQFIPAMEAKMKALLNHAASLGMVVDMSGHYTNTGNTGLKNEQMYTDFWKAVTEKYKSYRNVYFDIANEHTVMDGRYVSPEAIKRIRNAIKAIDPNRIVTASCSNDPRAEDLDFHAPHLARDAQPWNDTLNKVPGLISQYKLPVHLQEPFRNAYGGASYPFDTFCKDLKAAVSTKAAGWCFHTEAGFNLAQTKFFDKLDAAEKDVVNRVAKECGPAVTPPTPEPQPGGGTLVISDSLFGRTDFGIVKGGSFSANGYTINSNNNYIGFLTQITGDIRVELDVVGLRGDTTDKAYFLEVFDTGLDANWVGGDTYWATNSYYQVAESGNLFRLRIGGHDNYAVLYSGALAFDGNKKYHLVMDIKGGTASISRDGQVIVSQPISGFNPHEKLNVRIGGSPVIQSPLGVTYSNVKIYKY